MPVTRTDITRPGQTPGRRSPAPLPDPDRGRRSRRSALQSAESAASSGSPRSRAYSGVKSGAVISNSASKLSMTK